MIQSVTMPSNIQIEPGSNHNMNFQQPDTLRIQVSGVLALLARKSRFSGHVVSKLAKN